MSLILVLSIAIRLTALGIALVLLKRLSDWRIGFLAAMVGLMTLRQVLTLAKDPFTWTVSASANVDELPGLAVSVLALLAILFVGRMIHDRDSAHEERQRTRMFVEAVLDNIENGIVACDANGQLTLFNNATREFHGLPEKPIHPDEWAEHFDLYMPDGVTLMRKEDIPLFRAFNGELVRDSEMVIAPKDRPRRTLLASGRAIVDASGNRLGAVVSMHDVTERQRIENLLREREARLEGIMNNVSDGIITIDPNGVIESFNPSAEKIFGYPADEVEGRNVTILMPEPYHGEHDGYIASYLRTGKGKILGIGPREVTGRRMDGTTVPLELGISEMWLADQRLFIGLLRDISERKRLENELDRFFRVSPNLLCVASFDGYFLRLNPAWEQSLGYTRAELMAKPFIEFVRPEDRERTIAEAQSLSGGTFTADFENRYVAADGTDRVLLWNAVGLPEEGIIYGSAYDITDRKRTEAQLQQATKMEAVGHLTGGVAHDFNNLLTVIIGNLQLMERRAEDDERLRKRVRAALEAALRGAELTKRLLAFSRRQVLEPEVVDLNGLIAGMDELLRRSLGEAVEIKTVLADELWQTAVDPSRLESVLLNLAINARDAMAESGKLTIETANAHLDDGYVAHHPYVGVGDYVMLAVSDTGTGMSAEVIEHAFEPFYTTKEVGKGSGLGLSMAYGFVKQSGGHLNIYSEEGHGTTVKVYLPRAGRDGPAAAEVAEVAPPEAAVQVGGETILVVEDNAAVRQIAIEILRDLGFRVLEADDGPTALKVLDADREIDLLLTDMVMPGGMSGAELASEARERRPDLKVLYTSGYTEDAIVHGGMFDESIAMISKPYRKEELAQKVRRVLGS